MFVGRSTELALIGNALDAAIAGRTQLVLLTGEPGIGKTSLADAVARLASTRSVAVAWGRCWEFGGAPALWPWAQVVRTWSREPAFAAALDGLGPARTALAALDPERLGAAADAGEPDPGRARFRLFRAATDLVVALAAAQPRLIVLDDLHAADAPSLLLLRALLRDAGDARLCVVGTFRDVQADPPDEVRALLAALGRDGRRIALGGLGEHDVGVLVADALGRAGSSAFVHGLRATTGGNPFYLGEILTHLAIAGDGDPPQLAIPPGVREAVAAQLARLDGAAAGLVTAAAVLGRPAPAALIAAVAGGGDAAAALARALAERILVERPDEAGAPAVAFAHALFRETAYQALGPEARRRLHLRAGEALEAAADADARAAELAHHFAAAVAAGAAGASPRAIAYARRAAARAMRGAAYEDAVAQLELAARLAGDGDDARAIRLALGDAQVAAGQRPRAAETFRDVAARAEAAGAAADLARAAIGVARTLEYVTLDPAAIALLERARVALRDEPGALRVRLHAQLAVALWMDPAARDRRDALSRAAVDEARASGDAGLYAFALGARLQAMHGPDGVAERLAAAEEILRLGRDAGDLERIADGLRWRVGALLELGDMAGADPDIETYAQIAGQLRLPHLTMNAAMRQAMRALAAGRWDEAEQRIARTHAIAVAALDPTADLVRACATAALAVEVGRPALLEAAVPVLAAEADRLHWGVFIRAQLARALATLGRVDEARRELGRVVERDFARLPRDFVHVATLALIAEVAIAVDDGAIAARARELLAPYGERNVTGAAAFPMGSAWRYLGRLAGFLGDRAAARRELALAIARDDAMAAAPAGVHDRIALAALLATGDAGERASALELAAEARSRAAALAMAPAEAQAAALLAGAGARPPPPLSGAPDSAALRRAGETWTLEHGGRAVALRDRRGLGYLARLLGEAGRSIHVLDLVAPDAPTRAQDGLPVIDARARAAYRTRLEALREQAEEASARGDLARADASREEIDALAAELGRALGLGGRDRRTGGAAERARSAVTVAIRRAIAAIAEVAPELGRHLEVSVKTGVFCVYAPEPRARIAWRVTT